MRELALAGARATVGAGALRWGALRWAVVGAVLAVAVAVRAAGRQPGLLYPDGYQYLLMARGLGEHLRPIVALGPGGDLFVPSVDAAAKPLFPALVALLSALGLDARTAADAVTVAAGAAVAILAGGLALRLTRSTAAALVATAAVLVSPAAGYWSGFAGPDALGAALALAATVALVDRRPALGGVLVALAIACRPELLVLGAAVALATAGHRVHRAAAGRAVLAAMLTLAVLLGLLRPPLGAPSDVWQLPLAVAATAAVLAAAWWAGGRTRVAAAAGVTLVAGMAAIGATSVPAVGEVLATDWPLALAAAAGLATAASLGAARPALIVAVCALTLGALYAAKNPHSARYVSFLIPFAAIEAALAVGAVRARAGIRGGTVAVGIAGVLLATTMAIGPLPRADVDTFARVAAHVPADGPPLISAAPDAYAVLLPHRSHRLARPGARGLLLDDGSLRAYLPELRITGRRVRRIPAAAGFLRPDGTVDRRAAVVVRGRIAPVDGGAHDAPSTERP